MNTGRKKELAQCSALQQRIGTYLFGKVQLAAVCLPLGRVIATIQWRTSGMQIAINGVWGNLGVGCVALLDGELITHARWRSAFILQGIVSGRLPAHLESRLKCRSKAAILWCLLESNVFDLGCDWLALIVRLVPSRCSVLG